MPEGPEIRLAADRIAKVLVGHRLEKVEFGLKRLEAFARLLTGDTVTAIDTRGKAMLTRFASGLTLYSHNQLYGRWFTARRPSMPATRRSLRVALYTATHSALLYSASDIDVLNERQLARHPFLRRVGPDILDTRLLPADIVARLDDPRFRKRRLASLYLDQGFLAGNGNYLRSEILWAARIRPSRRPADLSATELDRLARETKRISRRSYKSRGVTTTPSLASSLRSQGLAYEQYRFFAYGRAGLPCYRCDAAIACEPMAGRNLFICRECQL